MSATKTTFIDTNTLPRRKTANGEVTEIVNRELAGAENVLCMLRWLQGGEQFAPEPSERHQLIYLMDGRGRITLDGKDHEVSKGSGLYLGPFEVAAIQADPGASLKLFHVLVPKISE